MDNLYTSYYMISLWNINVLNNSDSKNTELSLSIEN
jgi:hypothetical protein